MPAPVLITVRLRCGFMHLTGDVSAITAVGIPMFRTTEGVEMMWVPACVEHRALILTAGYDSRPLDQILVT